MNEHNEINNVVLQLVRFIINVRILNIAMHVFQNLNNLGPIFLYSCAPNESNRECCCVAKSLILGRFEKFKVVLIFVFASLFKYYSKK